MNCAEERLNGLVDGQLSEAAKGELDLHLRDCAVCRARLEALEAQHRELEAAFAPARAEATSLGSRLAAQFEAPAKARFPWRLLAATAAGALAAILLFPRPSTPEKIVVKTVDPREQAAWLALEAVHAYARKSPEDHAGFAARCATVVERHPGTAAGEAARKALTEGYFHSCTSAGEQLTLEGLRKQLEEAAAKAARREEFDVALALLDEELNLPVAREAFGAARTLLEGAKARRPEAAWTKELDRRRGLLEARIAAQTEAVVAAAKGGEARVHRARVEAWGVAEALARFDRDVGAIPEPKKEPLALPQAPRGWRVLASIGDLEVPGAGGILPVGGFVATRERVLCALESEAGDLVRLNAGARVELEAARGVDLREGELFVRSKGPEPFEVACGALKIVGKNAAFTVARHDERVQVKGGGRVVIRVAAFQGELSVGDRPLQPGESLRLADGRPEPPAPAGPKAVETAWMLPLLEGRERSGQVQGLALLLDDRDLGKSSDTALRALGAAAGEGVVELLRQGKMPGELRRRLAKLLADLGGADVVPELVDFLRDFDPAIRAEAARGLERITGQTQDLPKTTWSGAGYERGARTWEVWLERHGAAWGGGPPKK